MNEKTEPRTVVTIECICGEDLQVSGSNEDLEKLEGDVRDVRRFAMGKGWVFYFVMDKMKVMCPRCSTVNALLSNMDAAKMTDMPVWPHIKEIATDSLEYEDLFNRVIEFNQFWNESQDAIFAAKMLDKMEYDFVKEWLTNAAKLRNKGAR